MEASLQQPLKLEELVENNYDNEIDETPRQDLADIQTELLAFRGVMSSVHRKECFKRLLELVDSAESRAKVSLDNLQIEKHSFLDFNMRNLWVKRDESLDINDAMADLDNTFSPHLVGKLFLSFMDQLSGPSTNLTEAGDKLISKCQLRRRIRLRSGLFLTHRQVDGILSVPELPLNCNVRRLQRRPADVTTLERLKALCWRDKDTAWRLQRLDNFRTDLLAELLEKARLEEPRIEETVSDRLFRALNMMAQCEVLNMNHEMNAHHDIRVRQQIFNDRIGREFTDCSLERGAQMSDLDMERLWKLSGVQMFLDYFIKVNIPMKRKIWIERRSKWTDMTLELVLKALRSG